GSARPQGGRRPRRAWVGRAAPAPAVRLASSVGRPAARTTRFIGSPRRRRLGHRLASPPAAARTAAPRRPAARTTIQASGAARRAGYAATAPAQAGSWPPTAATPTNAAPPASEPARPARESPPASRGAATVAAARPQPASQVRHGSMGQSPTTAATITRPPHTTSAFAGPACLAMTSRNASAVATKSASRARILVATSARPTGAGRTTAGSPTSPVTGDAPSSSSGAAYTPYAPHETAAGVRAGSR